MMHFLAPVMVLSNFNFWNALQVAQLKDEDVTALNNLRMLGGQPDTKKSLTAAFGLKFDIHKVISSLDTWFYNVAFHLKTLLLSCQKKRAARKDRAGEEGMWQLSRFYPTIEVQISLIWYDFPT